MRFRRKAVAVSIVVFLSVFGVSHLQAQGTVTLASLSQRVSRLVTRVSTLERTRASNARVLKIENRLATVEARLGRTSSVPTVTQPRSTSTPVLATLSVTVNSPMGVRRGPSAVFDRLGSVAVDDKITVSGKNAAGDWWRIEYEGQEGWVYAPNFSSDRVRIVSTPVWPTITPRPTRTPTRVRPTATRRPPTSTPTRVRPTATPTPAQPYIRIASRNMNVRRGPGTNYTVIGYATTGQEFDITGRNADGTWWRIDFEGEDAWIYAPFVTAVNADRIRSVPTPIPPTAVPPTATPVPASNTTQGMSEEDVIQSIMLTDYQYNESAFNNLTQSQKEYVITGYILLLEYVTDYCGLSYGNMAQLLDSYASDLDEIRFTGEDGAKPRGWLMAFVYGFTRDSSPGTYPCNTVLDWGRAAALSN